jgi:putative oxidoreductase
MNSLITLTRLHAGLGALLDRLQSPVLLVARVWVSWQFLKSGWLKLSSWESTVSLFESEYRVPLLSPTLAAVAGTFGELFFPVLLIAGLFARVGALGLFAVNALAVVSYAHVLLGEGFEAALGQHVLWGVVLLGLTVFGPGRISADSLLARQAAARCRPSPYAATTA